MAMYAVPMTCITETGDLHVITRIYLEWRVFQTVMLGILWKDRNSGFESSLSGHTAMS